ncbi:LexA family transcriptional regulator (plasmid) [Photobacterium damselae subsp. piscicida]|uniref:LexA family transcriptional regulator n=1 Tax=Photobacterium damsela subsp. piscicida TaxID=38294 RepID=A0A7L8AAP9_PHODP|nr:XRE family transcriptional regulator [Photobacterium damselae]MBE8127846.1 LexA family transcriptional regulator [Photobacterium damselae subsp. piscicida]QOD55293.1 LexA family transcriptional regulator [Photobacterium damselae subsp. piscicida]QOD59118.1 LexA family transcriptional regulator [Photobacterium damselae subsp. piscicida]
MRTIGEKIRALRESKNMTQEQLAKKIGVAPVTVSKWELDTSKPKSASTVKLGEIFNVSSSTFISHKAEIKIIHNMVSIPFYSNVKAAAGSGCLCLDENYELIQVPDKFVKNQDDVFAITIFGDSMEPVFGNETIVFIDPMQKNVIDGSVYVFIHDGLIRMKILEETPKGFRLRSYNNAYSNEDVQKEFFHLIGKVVAQMQKYN